MKKFTTFFLITLLLNFVATAQTAQKTVTNKDLEKFRQKRQKDDPDDESERRKLGLPSRAEIEKEQARRARETGELAARIRREKAAAENFWQSRAFELKTEIAAVEAEINYVRARIGEIPQQQTYYAVGYNPYYVNCCYGGIGFPVQHKTVVTSSQIGVNVNIGKNPQISVGASAGQIGIRQNHYPLNAGAGGLSFGGIPYQPGILTVPFTLPNAQNLTREELLARLRLLEQNRAGLYARFSVVEDEAHRDGVVID